jgi:streptomycin 6-kinase
MSCSQLADRVSDRIDEWGLVIDDTLETPGSVVAFGRRGNQPVVLKVLRRPGDEWRCGEALQAFDGRGTVRVYEYVDGAVLLERLKPGTALARLALEGRDNEATEILAQVIQQMSEPREGSNAFPTVQDWGSGFERYTASGDCQIPKSLVERAQHLYWELCASQPSVRLLHGDLQHYNVLFDSVRGWLAIDPKGIVGEVEYEIGASLRNPYENPRAFASPERIKQRLMTYESILKINSDRALAWGFAQAVLSAIWSVEDGSWVNNETPSIVLANAMLTLF